MAASFSRSEIHVWLEAEVSNDGKVNSNISVFALLTWPSLETPA